MSTYRRLCDVSIKAEEVQIMMDKGVTDISLPTAFGNFRIRTFDSGVPEMPHIVLDIGLDGENHDVLVRVHSECMTGDVFSSRRCDCRSQLEGALKQITQRGRGALLYLRQEGRGIGLEAKLKAYALQQDGLDTYEANTALGLPVDARDYSIVKSILDAIGVRSICLITRNPEKVRAVRDSGVELCGIVRGDRSVYPENKAYLDAKQDRIDTLILNRDA